MDKSLGHKEYDLITLPADGNDKQTVIKDEELGGWRLGYDTAWVRDIEEGSEFAIRTRSEGWVQVRAVEVKGKGFIMKPTGDKVSSSLYVL